MELNVRGFCVVSAALSEQPEDTVGNTKGESGRRGGLIGGPSRAWSVSAERRREIARAASRARRTKASRKTT
jgi:hypothetical protein